MPNKKTLNITLTCYVIFNNFDFSPFYNTSKTKQRTFKSITQLFINENLVGPSFKCAFLFGKSHQYLLTFNIQVYFYYREYGELSIFHVQGSCAAYFL